MTRGWTSHRRALEAYGRSFVALKNHEVKYEKQDTGAFISFATCRA